MYYDYHCSQWFKIYTFLRTQNQDIAYRNIFKAFVFYPLKIEENGSEVLPEVGDRSKYNWIHIHCDLILISVNASGLDKSRKGIHGCSPRDCWEAACTPSFVFIIGKSYGPRRIACLWSWVQQRRQTGWYSKASGPPSRPVSGLGDVRHPDPQATNLEGVPDTFLSLTTPHYPIHP